MGAAAASVFKAASAAARSAAIVSPRLFWTTGTGVKGSSKREGGGGKGRKARMQRRREKHRRIRAKKRAEAAQEHRRMRAKTRRLGAGFENCLPYSHTRHTRTLQKIPKRHAEPHKASARAQEQRPRDQNLPGIRGFRPRRARGGQRGSRGARGDDTTSTHADFGACTRSGAGAHRRSRRGARSSLFGERGT